MHDIEPPAYLEAYPRLSIGEAWKNQKVSRTVLLWRNNHHHVAGIVEVTWATRDTIVLMPHIKDADYYEGSVAREVLNIIWKGSTPGNERPYAECCACKRHIEVVIYNELAWRCKSCHNLKNRSAILDEVCNITLQLASIEKEISDGRPRGMSQRVFDDKQREIGDLTVRLRRRSRRLPDSRYRFWVSGSWEEPYAFHDHLRAGCDA